MYFLQRLTILVILLLIPKHLIKCEPDWTYDLVDLTVENHTPDIVFTNLNITRPRRGIFALNGTIDIKKDLTDELHIDAISYYSLSGGGSNFIKTPFYIPELDLSSFLNTFYKNLVMESSVNCCENAVEIKDTFVAPLTKRVIRLNNCIMSNDNMPSKLRLGYYKIIFRYRKQAEGNIELIIKVEPK